MCPSYESGFRSALLRGFSARMLGVAALCAAGALVAAGNALAQASGAPTIRPMLWQAGMKRSDIGEVNVFRRFPAERTDKMREFYNEVLEPPAR